MRLPTLPKFLKKDDLLFYRRRRENSDFEYVEYAIYNRIVFLGSLTYRFKDENLTIYKHSKSKFKLENIFRDLLTDWKKEQQFNRDMKSILR